MNDNVNSEKPKIVYPRTKNEVYKELVNATQRRSAKVGEERNADSALSNSSEIPKRCDCHCGEPEYQKEQCEEGVCPFSHCEYCKPGSQQGEKTMFEPSQEKGVEIHRCCGKPINGPHNWACEEQDLENWKDLFFMRFLTQDGRGWIFKNCMATGEDLRDEQDAIKFIDSLLQAQAKQIRREEREEMVKDCDEAWDYGYKKGQKDGRTKKKKRCCDHTCLTPADEARDVGIPSGLEYL